MAKEIERKFLVRDSGVIKGRVGSRIVQGYIASEPMTVRVRIIEAEAFLTLKSKATGIERDEYEFPIDPRMARELIERHCGGRIVTKTRYRIPNGVHTIELDVFDGRLEGLVLAEIELDHAEQPFIKPDWLGDDVSHDQRYANSSLAVALERPVPLALPPPPSAPAAP
ncbi:MAG: CYTH domain-containing protein [Sulfurisoma sp.]|nr:CYTH domain-containing protein [Sulfurisoma sp.]